MAAEEKTYTVAATATVMYSVTMDATSRFDAANRVRQAIVAAIGSGEFAPDLIDIKWDVQQGGGGK